MIRFSPRKTGKTKMGGTFDREAKASDHLPYTYHYNAKTIATRAGMLMQVIRLHGIPYETQSNSALNLSKLNRSSLFESVGNENLALYFHTVHRPIRVPSNEVYPNEFAQALHNAYQDKQNASPYYDNELYLTVVVKGKEGPPGWLNRVTPFFRKHRNFIDQTYLEQYEQLDMAVNVLVTGLKAYQSKLLSVVDTKIGPCSEPLAFLSALYNGTYGLLRLPSMDLSQYLPAARVFFGHETIELRNTDQSKYGAILSIKEYPFYSDVGMLDDLMSLPHEFISCQSIAWIDRQKALDMLSLQERRLDQAGDYAVSLEQELPVARDEIASGRLKLGYHQLSIMPLSPSEALLKKAVTDFTTKLILIGFKPVREDLNLEAAFWSQMPGNFKYHARKMPISSKNFASFASFHSVPKGSDKNNHWGASVTEFKTQLLSPYSFNFHIEDRGNTTIVGPTGSGKTLLMSFLAAQSLKFKARQIFFDKDRGAEIFIRAIGGHYRVVTPSSPSGFNPLLLPDTSENRQYLEMWFSLLLTVNGETLDAADREKITNAVRGNYSIESGKRRLQHIAPFFGKSDPHALSGRLKLWYGEGSRAYLFDCDHDDWQLNVRTPLGLDLTSLLEDNIGRTPFVSYLMHRIKSELNGERLMIWYDEGWRFLDDPIFISTIDNDLKTIRKKNGFVVFATNDIGNASNSPIADNLASQCFTKIFFPDPNGNPKHYAKFGLTEQEFTLISTLDTSSRAFLLKRGGGEGSGESVVAKLDLTGMEQFIKVLSGRTDSVKRLDRIRRNVGDDPVHWLPLFLEEAS